MSEITRIREELSFYAQIFQKIKDLKQSKNPNVSTLEGGLYALEKRIRAQVDELEGQISSDNKFFSRVRKYFCKKKIIELEKFNFEIQSMKSQLKNYKT